MAPFVMVEPGQLGPDIMAAVRHETVLKRRAAVKASFIKGRAAVVHHVSGCEIEPEVLQAYSHLAGACLDDPSSNQAPSQTCQSVIFELYRMSSSLHHECVAQSWKTRVPTAYTFLSHRRHRRRSSKAMRFRS